MFYEGAGARFNYNKRYGRNFEQRSVGIRGGFEKNRYYVLQSSEKFLYLH